MRLGWCTSHATHSGTPFDFACTSVNRPESFGGEPIEGNDCVIIKAKNVKFSKPLGDEKILPEVYALFPAYPNPFNPSTTIRYALPKEEMVEVSIYNSLGQKIAVLVNSHQSQGNYSINWQPSGLPSGLYIISFTTNHFHQMEKLLLVK